MSRELELLDHTIKFYRFKMTQASMMHMAVETYEKGTESMSWYYLLLWAQHSIDNLIFVDVDGAYLARGIV